MDTEQLSSRIKKTLEYLLDDAVYVTTEWPTIIVGFTHRIDISLFLEHELLICCQIADDLREMDRS